MTPLWSFPLRILMIASEAPPIRSGIARSIERLQDGLCSRGHIVDVIAHPEVPRFVFGEVRLSALTLALPRLHRLFGAYDVVHVHGAVPTVSDVVLLYARWQKRNRPPVVYTHHCDLAVGPLDFPNRLYNRLHKGLVARSADAVVRTTLGYAGDDSAWVIPLGVDPDRFAPVAPRDPGFTVLFVGQFRPYKGARLLLRAMARVHGARLLLAGHGPELAEYRALATSLGLDVEFHVAPEDAELRELYGRAHVVVLPSINRAEAFGLVLLEGMAAGCVPVASDLSGIREVLGRIGFTFPPGSVDGLAARLRFLRDNPQLVQTVAARARARVGSFTWERTVIDYERLFTSLVAARHLRRTLLDSDHSADNLSIYASQVAASLNADKVQIFLADGQPSRLRLAASSNGSDAQTQLDQPAVLLASYAAQTGEIAVVTPERRPPHLERALGAWSGPAMAAPIVLSSGGEPFGAILAACEGPITDRDAEGLRMMAQYAGAPLWACHRRAVIERGNDIGITPRSAASAEPGGHRLASLFSAQ